VWKLGQKLQQGLSEVAARYSELSLKVAGMPCAPSFAFQPGKHSAAAKALCIRKMLGRGFLFSSQLYVMWPHTGSHVQSLLCALDESLEEVKHSLGQGRLESEAGLGETGTGVGFARLA
jgi:hypothetical protein